MPHTSSSQQDTATGHDASGTGEAPAMQKLREHADAVAQSLRPKLDAVSTFARDEPTKALLIAAAGGAVIIGLIALMARSGRRAPAPRATTMASIRDAALDLADRAYNVTASAIDGAQVRATAAADSVSESVSDAWKSLREQAAPVVERLRPQIDAVTTYAKEDPARAALGLAAVGAVLVGLMALIRRSEKD